MQGRFCSSTAVVGAVAAAVVLLVHAYHLGPAQSWSPLRLVEAPASKKAVLNDGPFGAIRHKLAERRARSRQLNEPWQQDFAFAVVTGSMTAQRRVPLQQITMFTHSIRNYILIGSGADPGFSGDQPVLDVATASLAHLETFHAQLEAQRRQNNSRHDSSGGVADSQTPAVVPDEALAAASAAGTATDAVPAQPTARRLMARMPKMLRLRPRRRQRRRLTWVTGDAAAGERMNRFKGVPGMAALYKAFPLAKWYIVIDDDTYFFVHNFRDFISKFDPDEELYAGNAMFYGPGQNDHTGEKFDGGGFAHGGEGIIVSRAAMAKFMAVHKECIERILESTYGVYTDTQIALCMQLAGVKYNETAFRYDSLLMVDPPAIVTERQAEREFPGWPPCSRPHSIHHLQMEHMQALYEAESRAPRLRPTYADVWRAMRSSFVTEEAERVMLVADMRLGAEDIKTVPVKGGDGCEALCETDDKCVGWTFVAGNENTCHLKGRWTYASRVEEKGTTISGAMLHRFTCNSMLRAAAEAP